MPAKPVICKGAGVTVEQNENTKLWTLQPIEGSPGVYYVMFGVRFAADFPLPAASHYTVILKNAVRHLFTLVYLICQQLIHLLRCPPTLP